MQLLKTYVAAATIIFLAIGTSACQRQNADVSSVGVSVGSVVGDPGAYYGSNVTVSGQVSDVVSPVVFTIRGGEAGENLLVVSTDSIAPASGRSIAAPLLEKDIVQVTGRLTEFDRAQIEDELGVDLSGLPEDVRGPVLVAREASAQLSSVIVTPAPGSVVSPPAESENVTDFAAVVADDADRLAGESAHFTDLQVAEVLDDQSFWATRDGDSLFVVLVSGAINEDAPTSQLEPGQTWQVYGNIREVPPNTELKAAWKLTDDVVGKLSDDPVYLHGIYAVAQ